MGLFKNGFKGFNIRCGLVKPGGGSGGGDTPVEPVFPEEPSEYNLIDTYNSSITITVPETGYFKVELHGASGNGGNGSYLLTNDASTCASGGSGGGSAFSASIFKLKKGDNIIFTSGTPGNDSKVEVLNSSETPMICTSGTNGTNGATYANTSGSGGYKGYGGKASGGNLQNLNGSDGKSGKYYAARSSTGDIAGGSPAHADGNTGGTGGGVTNYVPHQGGNGSNGFIKIYRGNTNIVA